MVDPEAMEIIRRRFTINPTQRCSRARRRAGNKMLRKTGLLILLAVPTLSHTILCNH